MKIRVKAEIEQLQVIDEELDKLLAGQHCPEEVVSQLHLCIEEIFANIASYAYGEQGGMAEIEMELEEQTLVIRFEDEGIPYNPLEREAPDMDAPVEEREIGGFGIYLVRMMMDKVEYERKENRNCLCIRKQLS